MICCKWNMNARRRIRLSFLALLCAVSLLTSCTVVLVIPSGVVVISPNSLTSTPEQTYTTTPFLTPDPTPTAEVFFPTPQPHQLGRVTTAQLNVRSAPGVNNPIIGALYLGNVVRIIGENEARTWLQVENENGVLLGWVSVQYVERDRG